MEHHTILYIYNRANRSNSVLAALKETGCEVVRASSPTEGVALLYVMHTVAAVVLDSRAKEHANFDVAQSLRQIRPRVPVMLQCGDQIDCSPSQAESCVKTNRLTSALQTVLIEHPVA